MNARLKAIYASIFEPIGHPAPPQTGPQMEEVGLSGTPIFYGFLRDLGEYNSDLTGLSSYRSYEKMRRSDTTVNAALAAVKLPIGAAAKMISPPENPTAIEKEAVAFIEEQFFERINLKKLFENALLMLDFGAAAHEDCYEIDGDRVCLKKAAPRLPLTFYKWDVAEDGETLRALVQYGYRGPQFAMVPIPAEKLSLFTYRQEGANFAGRSMLREAYQHWYIKQALYRIDSISLERNGMGVPTIILGPDAKKEDRAAAATFLNNLTAHEHASIMLPNGYTFSLEGIKGQTRDCKESIHHHNVQISMASLAQFLMLGEQKGARSLGDTLSDFFTMGVQSVANDIAEIISHTTIERLVRFNFGEQCRPPHLVVQKILSLNFETIAKAIADLGDQKVGLIQSDDVLEQRVREMMGLPDPDKNTQRKPQISQKPTVAAKGASLDAGAQKPPVAASTLRQPRGPEKFLALAEITSHLDRGRDEVAAELRSARANLQTEILHKLLNAPVRNLHRVSIAPDEALTSKIEGILSDVATFGADQVTAEGSRQRHTARSIRGSAKSAKSAVGVYADAAVSEFTNNLQSRAANVVVSLKRQGTLRAGELLNQAAAELDAQSDKWIDNVAASAANNAFADGRADGYAEHKDEIGSVLYSSILDGNTCDACQEADGEEGATPDDIPDVPNPDCDGGDKCRCVHVYVFSDEGKAA